MSQPSPTPLPQPPLTPRVKIWFESEQGYSFGYGLIAILQAVDREGSIKQAAGALGQSYRHVWGRIKEAEEALALSLVETHVGGQGTQRSGLTDAAHELVRKFLALRTRMFEVMEQERGLAPPEQTSR